MVFYFPSFHAIIFPYTSNLSTSTAITPSAIPPPFFHNPHSLPFHTGCHLTAIHRQSPLIAIPCHSFFIATPFPAMPFNAIHCQSPMLCHCCHSPPFAVSPLSPSCLASHAGNGLNSIHCIVHNSHHAQMQRMVNANFNTRTTSRHLRACSQSPPCTESARKHRRLHSPNWGYNQPSDCAERCTQDSSQCVRRDKLEIFQAGAGSCGGVCMVCLSHHDHTFAK